MKFILEIWAPAGTKAGEIEFNSESEALAEEKKRVSLYGSLGCRYIVKAKS